MTFYTAIGKYEFRKDKDGNKLPVIIAEEKEHILDIWEMILWSSLIWNIHTHDEITKIFYQKEREVHVASCPVRRTSTDLRTKDSLCPDMDSQRWMHSMIFFQSCMSSR